MSHDYKALLRQANAHIAAGDIEGFLQYCTEDTQWIFVGEQTLSGKPAVRKYLEATYVHPPVFDMREMIAEGTSLAVLGEIALTDKPGRTTTSAYCDVWHFRDGKLHELRAYAIPLKDDQAGH